MFVGILVNERGSDVWATGIHGAFECNGHRTYNTTKPWF
jgi:hypothetical protein